MRTYIFISIFLFTHLGLASSSHAQITTFFKFSEPYKEIQRFGHPLTNQTQNEKTLKLQSLTDEILHLQVEFAYFKNAQEGDEISFTIGDQQQVTYLLDLYADKQYIIENGKKIEFNFVNGIGYPDRGFQSKIFQFRITKSYIQIYQDGEIGGIFYLKKQPIDRRDITIHAKSKNSTFATIVFNQYAYPKLYNFAESGLRLRVSEDLNSQKIASIPYGKEVLVFKEKPLAEDDDQYYYNQVVDTKGEMKVEDLQSRMIKVLYDGKIGYAYGGFLLPIQYFGDKKDDHYTARFEEWGSEQIAFDKVLVDDEVIFFKTVIDFKRRYWSGLSHSQRIFILEKLFPSLFTKKVKYPDIFNHHTLREILNQTSEASKSQHKEIADYQHNIKAEFDGGDIEAVLYFNKNELVKLEYIEKTAGFLSEISTTNQYVTATQLNVRKGGPSSEVIGKVKQGEIVELIGDSGDEEIIGGVKGETRLINFNYQNGQSEEGYVFDAYLSPIPVQNDYRETFQQLHPSRGNIQHFDDYLYDERNYCAANSYQPRWMIVYARDEFQLMKSFRNAFPELEKVKFEWNPSKNDYDITTSSSKVQIQHKENSICFLFGGENDYERPMLIIDKIYDNVFKVSVIDEFMGD